MLLAFSRGNDRHKSCDIRYTMVDMPVRIWICAMVVTQLELDHGPRPEQTQIADVSGRRGSA